MKLPVNFLLYLCSAGLLAQAGMWFVAASSRLKGEPPTKFHERGAAAAANLLAQGRGTTSSGANWVYGSSQGWWERFKNVNLTGKLPPPPPVKIEDTEKDKPPPSPDKPISQILDLVSLAFDGQSAGKGGDTHVVVRYKPEANVKPPEEVMRALQNPVSSGPRPSDVTAGPGGRGKRGGADRTSKSADAPAAAAPLPMAASGSPEILQMLRPGMSLWKDYEDIKLVEVSPDAGSAFFVRIKADAPPGTEPKREEVFKSSMAMTQEVQRLIKDMQQKGMVSQSALPKSAPAATASWLDVEETTRQGDIWHIGRNDIANFEGDKTDRFLERVNVDAYKSSVDSSVRGVQVRNVDSRLGQSYGVQAGDVLRSINDDPVRNKAEVLNVLRKQYNLGTRTFRTRWITATGQEVERIYQAPPGKNNS